jgi:hypothetical protein
MVAMTSRSAIALRLLRGVIVDQAPYRAQIVGDGSEHARAVIDQALNALLRGGPHR